MKYRTMNVPNKGNDGGRIVVMRRWLGVWWTQFTAYYGTLPAWSMSEHRSCAIRVHRDTAIAEANAALRNMRRQVEVIAETAESSGELSVVD